MASRTYYRDKQGRFHGASGSSSSSVGKAGGFAAGNRMGGRGATRTKGGVLRRGARLAGTATKRAALSGVGRAVIGAGIAGAAGAALGGRGVARGALAQARSDLRDPEGLTSRRQFARSEPRAAAGVALRGAASGARQARTNNKINRAKRARYRTDF